MTRNASNLDTGESGDAVAVDTCDSSGDCVVSALDGKDVTSVTPARVAACTAASASDVKSAVAGIPVGTAAVAGANGGNGGFEARGIRDDCILFLNCRRFGPRPGARIDTRAGGGRKTSSAFDVAPTTSVELLPSAV